MDVKTMLGWKSLFFSALLVIGSIGCVAQTDTISSVKQQFPSVSINFANGNILPTTDFVRGDNRMGRPMKSYQAYSLKMIWQNPGYKNWQKVFRSPYYGAGVMLGNFFNPEEVAYPVSVYGILGIPVKRWNKLELYAEFQFGLASNWKHYDPVDNPKNLVIGGGMTVHLNVGMTAFYPLTDHLDLGAGIGFMHFSNGGFERPNRGFNIYAPSVELKYHFRGRPELKLVKRPGRLERSNDLYIMIGYGDHQLIDHELQPFYYAVGGLSAIYFTQLSNAFRLGYGADINYWMGLNALPDGSMGPHTFENFTLGMVLQPEIIIDRLTLVSGIGIYARHLKYGNFQQPYQRLGIRFDVLRNFSVGVNIRAIHFTLAEFLEFNMGYRIRWIR